jgi:hypothetical protein
MKILLVYCNLLQQNALPMGVTQQSSCLKVGMLTSEGDSLFNKLSEIYIKKYMK